MPSFSLPSIVAESQWQWLGADSGTVNVETPEVNVGVAATGGRMAIKHRGTGAKEMIGFGGFGGSLGLSAVPSPVNFSYSTQNMPAAGVIYRVGRAGSSLELDEIKGPMIMLDSSADAYLGVSGTFILSGGSSFLLQQALNPTFMGVALPAFMMSCTSLMVISGTMGSILPGNIGTNAMVGAIV